MTPTITCPYCSNDDESMLEEIGFTAHREDPDITFKGITHVFPGHLELRHITYLCVSCSKEFTVEAV